MTMAIITAGIICYCCFWVLSAFLSPFCIWSYSYSSPCGVGVVTPALEMRNQVSKRLNHLYLVMCLKKLLRQNLNPGLPAPEPKLYPGAGKVA